ncbi:hypothetical protein MBLNU230_g0471t1 [Neophaeotheca triangularis]
MGPNDYEEREDVEATGGGAVREHERYHDDSDDSETVVGPDAPLRGSYSNSPSIELDGPVDRRYQPWSDRIAERIPPGVKRRWAMTKKWVKGPQPPQIYNIRPIFPKFQHTPIALLDRYAPKKAERFWLLIAVYASWLLMFSIVLYKSSAAASIPGYGNPVNLGCGAKYWRDGNGCGLNGDSCRPFSNDTMAFRCPADCDRTLVLNPHAVGDQEVVYTSLVVGGPTDEQTGFEGVIKNNAVYRGDSFICASAIHAGFISADQGGCGVLTLTGEQPSFTKSKHHGIKSIGFDSYFPQSFGFLDGSRESCKDLRWPLLAVTVFHTTLLSLFTTDPGVFFWSLFVALFFHVGLASDPPTNSNFYRLISIATGRFLPAAFCGWVTYRYTVRRSLLNLTAQIEKTVLWLGPAWAGALNNYTFDKIPIQRLTPHDLKQPGAVPALVIIVLTIFFIALGQAWAFRVEGRMPRYLLIYTIFVASLLLLVTIPGENVRIHHYVLALLLVPGTSFQNRPSLIYQGLLVGLFINGIARWGFDSILQTPGELLQGAPKGTLLPAVSVLAMGARNITFNLGSLPVYDPKTEARYDGISALVNDVERLRGYEDNGAYWDAPDGSGNLTWTWTRRGSDSEVEMNLGMGMERGDGVDADVEGMPSPEYFRFAYLSGSRRGDYSKAGVWESDGEWIPPKKGPS